MRGSDQRSGELFSYVDIEARVPARHPLRAIRSIVNDVLASLDRSSTSFTPTRDGSSIPPEWLLRAASAAGVLHDPLRAVLMEQLDYNLLYRWFVGLGVDDAVWDHSVFSKNRDRLLEADVAAQVLGCGARPPVSEAALVRRALLGRRYADRGVGLSEELPRQGRSRRAAVAGPQWRAGFP